MGKYIEVTDANFEEEVLKSDIPVLVDYWAVWCAPCKMIAPLVEEISEEKAGIVKVAKMDVDSNPGTATKFGIRSIPTLMIFKNGEVVDQIIGAVPKSMIEEKLQKHI
ncbi:MAG: thioredoxin [Calditrichia bacterium]|nr:thioredoxin [Calditrichia bacterium]